MYRCLFIPGYFTLLAWLVLIAAGCDGSGSDPDPPEGPRETHLDAALLQSAVKTQVQAAVVHLDNYGDQHDHSWHSADAAFIRFGAGELRFTIPESRSRVGPFRLLYYVRDLDGQADSATVTVEPAPSDLHLTVRLPFEQDGTEFKGHCISDTLLGSGGCLGSTDRIAPDVQLSDAALTLTLHPIVFEGGLSLEAVAVAFDGTVQAGGVCDLRLGTFDADVCDVLADYKDDIRATVETLVFDELRQPTIQAFLAAEIRPMLDALGIGEVLEVRAEGTQLLIVHHPGVPR